MKMATKSVIKKATSKDVDIDKLISYAVKSLYRNEEFVCMVHMSSMNLFYNFFDKELFDKKSGVDEDSAEKIKNMFLDFFDLFNVVLSVLKYSIKDGKSPKEIVGMAVYYTVTIGREELRGKFGEYYNGDIEEILQYAKVTLSQVDSDNLN